MLGRDGIVLLEPVPDGDASEGLARSTWTAPSRHWASVTPVALDRNPGDLFSRNHETATQATRNAQHTVARACERIGLPHPDSVRILRRSAFPAAPPASAFAPFPRRGNGLRRVCVHVDLAFGEPVAGPVLLAAGKHLGVGLLANIDIKIQERRVAVRGIEMSDEIDISGATGP
jgi:CRISPR-associated protein Csb2